MSDSDDLLDLLRGTSKGKPDLTEELDSSVPDTPSELPDFPNFGSLIDSITKSAQAEKKKRDQEKVAVKQEKLDTQPSDDILKDFSIQGGPASQSSELQITDFEDLLAEDQVICAEDDTVQPYEGVYRNRRMKKFTEEEDAKLADAIRNYGLDYLVIESLFPDREPGDIRARIRNIDRKDPGYIDSLLKGAKKVSVEMYEAVNGDIQEKAEKTAIYDHVFKKRRKLNQDDAIHAKVLEEDLAIEDEVLPGRRVKYLMEKLCKDSQTAQVDQKVSKFLSDCGLDILADVNAPQEDFDGGNWDF